MLLSEISPGTSSSHEEVSVDCTKNFPPPLEEDIGLERVMDLFMFEVDVFCPFVMMQDFQVDGGFPSGDTGK